VERITLVHLTPDLPTNHWHALSNNQIDTEIDGKSIIRVKEAKSLGLFIDEHLSWTKHIEEISKKISSAIGALN